MDVIGKITKSFGSTKHGWILVATDYFTKWVEAKSYAELTRFYIPEMIITDNDIIFTVDRFGDYTANLKFWLEQSTPYYPQVNGHAVASNKVMIGILEKIMNERPGMWHLRLNEALGAYRTLLRSTRTPPCALTYGHDAIWPVELSINLLQIIKQNSLFSIEYSQAMRQDLEDME
ncbi:hypothetical protein ACFX2H_013114 [Malus domestica]